MIAWSANTQARQLTELYNALRRSRQLLQSRGCYYSPNIVRGRKYATSMIQPRLRVSRLFLSGVLPAAMQQKLTGVARVLDLNCLLHQLVHLQQAVFLCAASCSSFVPNTPSAPLRIFCVDDCIKGTLSVEGSAPDPALTFHTLYR